jgi:hypothetical protein
MPSSIKRQVAGQPLAQVDNPDPFAVPVWRSPVYQTPHCAIWTVQLVRLVWRLVWFVLRHPLLDAICGASVFAWLKLGWPGLVALAAVAVLALGLAYVLWPDWFTRTIIQGARDWWRLWFYRRRWTAAMTLAGLAPSYRGRVLVPVLGGVKAAGAVDLALVRLVTGQAPQAFADRMTNLAQDPRKDVISLRNLFPSRIAMRLDESDQADMVLGDGARDRGALADEISPIPETGAGVGYVRLEGSPHVVRVRAAYVADEDIHAMARAVTSRHEIDGDGERWTDLPAKRPCGGLTTRARCARRGCSWSAGANPCNSLNAGCAAGPNGGT